MNLKIPYYSMMLNSTGVFLVDNLIFSQTAIFRLQQLGSAYYHYTGERHKLATQDGILDLLKDSALISERKVKTAYDAFVLELNKRQMDALAARGIKLRLPIQVSLNAPVRQAG
jgi:hypothetical protein